MLSIKIKEGNINTKGMLGEMVHGFGLVCQCKPSGQGSNPTHTPFYKLFYFLLFFFLLHSYQTRPKDQFSQLQLVMKSTNKQKNKMTDLLN